MLGAIVGAGLGMLSSKSSKKAAEAANPWAPAQSAAAQAYLPLIGQAQDIAKKPYPALPKVRAVDPASDPFASRALYDHQLARDAEAKQNFFKKPEAAGTANIPASALDTLRKELSAMGQARAGTSNQGTPGRFGVTPDRISQAGLARYYTLTPEQQNQIQQEMMFGQLDPATFSGKYGFDPFSYT